MLPWMCFSLFCRIDSFIVLWWQHGTELQHRRVWTKSIKIWKLQNILIVLKWTRMQLCVMFSAAHVRTCYSIVITNVLLLWILLCSTGKPFMVSKWKLGSSENWCWKLHGLLQRSLWSVRPCNVQEKQRTSTNPSLQVQHAACKEPIYPSNSHVSLLCIVSLLDLGTLNSGKSKVKV